MYGRVAANSLVGVLVLSWGLGAAATDLSNSVSGNVSDGNTTLPYRLFEPQGLSAGQKAPLVLFLHGMNDRGTDNVAQTNWMGGLVSHTQRGKYASYVLAPQIDTDSWFQSFSRTPTEAMSLTIAALKKVINTENIDTNRVYVTGLSMGGMGTWDILEREPKLFAAAVPMSGGGDVKSALLIKDVPVWAFHGGSDSVVSVSATRAMIAALNDAGGSPKYTEIAGADHVIWDPIYEDAGNTLYPWLFSQHLGELDAASPAPIAPIALSSNAGAVIEAQISAIPEPSTLGLMLIGATLTLRRRTNR